MKYVGATTLGLVVDFSILLVLTNIVFMDPRIATVIGLFAGGTVNFLLQKKWVFSDYSGRMPVQILFFALGALVVLLFRNLFFTMLIELSLYGRGFVGNVVCMVITYALSFILNLLINRLVVFPPTFGHEHKPLS